MKKICILNKENTLLFDEAQITTNFSDRLIGLLGRHEIKENEALCIKPCKCIHMFFMRFPIDVAFVNASGAIIYLIENLKPWSITKKIKNSDYVIEMPVGAIKKKKIQYKTKIICIDKN